MAKMSDWIANVNTHAITTKSSLVPKLYLSTVAPSSADLSAVATKETTDGWPSAVVTRNTLRRTSKFDLYVTPLGASLGPKPSYDLCPNLYSAVGIAKKPRGVKFVRGTDSAGAIDTRIKAIGKEFFETQEAALGFIQQRLLGVEDMPVAEIMYYANTTNDATYGYNSKVIGPIDSFCSSDESGQFLVVGFTVALGYYNALNMSGPGVNVQMVVKFLKGSHFPGIRGLFYTPNYVSSTWSNCVGDQTGWSLAALWADRGIDEYLLREHSDVGLYVVDAPITIDNFRRAGNYDSTPSSFLYKPCGTNEAVAVSWWNGGRTRFEKNL